jgi:hypothetical protein
MRVAQFVSLLLGAIGLNDSQGEYALGKPRSDAVDHVDP